ncbi:TolC family outer membrane protein [Limibaculum sp. FT325]|uniref:TolC family outer membrane protein n=1 Tax=Thermohalobaculum sediminis TaxID=2939436 RepID=UPI0020BD6CC1|nr:TolC family outer membrane protein [Limibaculum sediminis]MCL5775401.1 TolC family outer membrane protein [Limibaculum sediminis]
MGSGKVRWPGARGAVPAGVRRGLAAALVCSVFVPAWAGAQTLSDTLVSAYTSNPDIAAQRANVKVFSERAVQARAEGRLNVTGLTSFTFQRDVSENFDDSFFPLTLRLEADQPLYTGGQVENATEAAEKRITGQETLLIATEQDVLLNAATAFFNVRRDIAFVDLGINNVRVLTEQLRAATERFEVGEVTRTDVEQARARLAASQSQLAAARGSLAASREAYLRIVGVPALDLAPPPPLPAVPDALADAVGIALVNDPTILAARIERDASGSDVRSAIGALLPQVSLVAQAQHLENIDSSQVDYRSSASAGVLVTVPFYQGGGNYSRVREAQAGVERSVADITASERFAVQNVGVAWADLQVARASIQNSKLEISAARLAFEGVQEEAKVGARTTLDVLDAEQEFLDARVRLVAVERDEAVATYQLLAAMGKLTVDHLGLRTEPEGQSYYQTVRNRHFGYDRTDDTVWQFKLRP